MLEFFEGVGRDMQTMKSKKYEIPIRVDVCLITGESKTTYKTLSKEEYKKYEDAVLKPFAVELYDHVVQYIAKRKKENNS